MTDFKPDPDIRNRDSRIGCIGAGMIMAECHLAAYAQAGFPVVAIACDCGRTLQYSQGAQYA